MLSSTKRYILHCISVTLAIGCLATGLVMKYSISESPELSVAETQNIEPLTISKIESDSLEVNTIDYSVSNPD